MTIDAPNRPLRRVARAATTTLSVAILVACGGQVSQNAAQSDDAAYDRQEAGGANQPAPPTPMLEHEHVSVSGARVTSVDLKPAAPVATSGREIADASTFYEVAPTAKTSRMPTQALAAFGLTSATPPALDRERYAILEDQGIKLTADTPVSTFSVDVDTGAYSNVRRFLNDGALPPTTPYELKS